MLSVTLMAKMKMSERERPRVKLECLRLLATLRLDSARTKLIGGFIENYLNLSAQESKQYEREFAALDPQERQTTMALVSSWEQRGIDQGIEQGKEHLISLIIQDRFGQMPAETAAQIARLSSEQFDELGRALLRFDTLTDLDRWLSLH